MPRRRCLDCTTLTSTSRCPRCAAAADRDRRARLGHPARYGGDWDRRSRDIRAAWLAEHGPLCPGWDTPAHDATDLVVDHDIGVLCRPCNSRKAATTDKQRVAH
jgi:hypothetical protein